MIIGLAVCAGVCGLSVVGLRRLHDVHQKARLHTLTHGDAEALCALQAAQGQLANARAVGYAVLIASVIAALLTTLTRGGFTPVAAGGLLACAGVFLWLARRAFDAQLHAMMATRSARTA